MAKVLHKKEKLSLQHRILLILHKNSIIFLAALGIIAATLIIIAVVSNVQAKKLEADTQKIEEIQDQYSTYLSTTDTAKKAELKKKITGQLTSIIEKGVKTYPLERALFIQGNLYYKDKEWVKSAESFVKLSNLFPKSYLSAVALIDSAAAYEENNSIDKAMESYQRVVDRYSDMSPDIPSALFSIGRLYEAKKDTKSALKTYNSLIDRFPASNWTNLARSRIIYLETKK